MDQHEIQICMLSNLADRKRKEGDRDAATKLFSYALSLLSKYGASPANEAALLTNFGIFLVSLGKGAFGVRPRKQN
jgi:Tfp pilus assembly protein PilF